MIDLKELLEQRSAAPPGLGDLRMDQVRQRITTRRRRRIAVGALAAVVVLLLLGGYQLIPALRTAPPADPAPSPSSVGFPQHTWGAALVASAAAPLPEQKVSLTWTPTTLDVVWSVACHDLPESASADVQTLVNGRLVVSAGCGGTGRLHGEQFWIDSGVRIGQPATITVNVLRTDQFDAGLNKRIPIPIPAAGTLAVAIYERVPFEVYPLPPRPAQLEPLHPSLGCYPDGYRDWDLATRALHSDPSDPRKPMSLTVEWREYLEYHYRSQTPGLLHVAINGHRVDTGEWWDYKAGDSGTYWNTRSPDRWQNTPGWVHPRQGDMVTITVTPQHVTGAWQFHIATKAGGGWSSACGTG